MSTAARRPASGNLSAGSVTGTVLQRLTERLDAGIMLHKGYFKTDPASYARSRDNILFGAADWPARLCKQIQGGQDLALEAETSSTAAPIYRSPNSLQMLRFLWISTSAWIANQFQTLYLPGAAVERRDHRRANRGGRRPCGRHDPGKASFALRAGRPEPKGRFLADPFAISNGDGLTILAEDFDWQTNCRPIAGST